jgi:hypothetical protein
MKAPDIAGTEPGLLKTTARSPSGSRRSSNGSKRASLSTSTRTPLRIPSAPSGAVGSSRGRR